MGQYREAQLDQHDLNDSGYVTPAKRSRIDRSLGKIPEPIIDEIESAYNETYLVKSGSLVRSYKQGSVPPVMDDPLKMVKALRVSPSYSGGLRSQIDRMSHYRHFPVQQDEVVVVDLTNSDQD